MTVGEIVWGVILGLITAVVVVNIIGAGLRWFREG